MAPNNAGIEVGPVGYGMAGIGFNSNQEQAIAILKAALNAGANYWNAAEFYGTPESNSLTHINAYFKKYPEDAEKVVINVKGATQVGQLWPDDSEEGIRRSVDNCLKLWEGTKTIDEFECARVDPEVPIEESMAVLAQLVKEGKIGAIALSEVKAETIRRAHKIYPISAVEVELSRATEPLTNGVAETCAELGIRILAYCPIGRGFLTGQVKSLDDIPADSWQRMLPRYQPGAFEKNLELVKEIENMAAKKGCTPAQLALGWLRTLIGKDGNPIIIPIPGTSSESRLQENMKEVVLTDDELGDVDRMLKGFEIVGTRYPGKHNDLADAQARSLVYARQFHDKLHAE